MTSPLREGGDSGNATSSRTAPTNQSQSQHVPHTPGPWTVETVKTQIGVCHKIGPFPGSCGREIGYGCVYEDGTANWRVMDRMNTELLSNARLMAAAPALLAALKKIADWTDCGCEDHASPNCCGALPVEQVYCPGCIAARAIALAEGHSASGPVSRQ